MTVSQLIIELAQIEDPMTEVVLEKRYKTGHDEGDIYHSPVNRVHLNETVVSDLGRDPVVVLSGATNFLVGGW